MKFYIITFAIVTLYIMDLTAQQINLNFPYFGGQTFDFVLFRGDVADTVFTEVIPKDGKVLLRIPERQKKYAGMARWLLRSGGGLDFVVNGEDFSVECLSETPNEDNIVFSNTNENSFLNQNFFEQERIMAQYDAMRLATQAYPKDDPIYETFEKEIARLEEKFNKFQEALAASPLYSARFREIVNFTRGVGTSLSADEEKRAKESDEFVSQRLDWEALYTSNHWGGVIYSWFQMHLLVLKNDDDFLRSARKIFSRINDAELYTAFSEKFAYYMVKNSKDSLLAVIGPEIRQSGKLTRFDGLLGQFNTVNYGEKAPDLFLVERLLQENGPKYKTRVLKSSDLSNQKSLLVFYQSGCGPCETTMEELIKRYDNLSSKGFRLISISADTDLKLFEEYAQKYPWPDKYCDGAGFEGANYRNYGVAGTPTIFVIDKSGIVITRAGGLPEIQKWLEFGG